MPVRVRLALLACFGKRIPDAIEQHKHDANPMVGGESEETIHALQKACAVLPPRDVMQEHAHRGEPERLRPAQLAVNRSRIPGSGLPELKLVNGGAGGEIAAYEPGLR